MILRPVLRLNVREHALYFAFEYYCNAHSLHCFKYGTLLYAYRQSLCAYGLVVCDGVHGCPLATSRMPFLSIMFSILQPGYSTGDSIVNGPVLRFLCLFATFTLGRYSKNIGGQVLFYVSFAHHSTGVAIIISPFGCLLANKARSNRKQAPRCFAIIFSIITVILFVSSAYFKFRSLSKCCAFSNSYVLGSLYRYLGSSTSQGVLLCREQLTFQITQTL